MIDNQADFQKLAGRIAKLERQNRFWKWGGVLVLLMLAFSLVTGLRAQEAGAQAPMRAKTIEAERFILRGADGSVQGQWSVTPGGGKLTLWSPDGKVIWSSEPRVQQ